MRQRVAQGILLVWLLTLLAGSVPLPARAASCTASVSPVSLLPNHSGNLSFTVTNTGGTEVAWVRLVAPSGNFQITGGSSSGWSRSLDSAQQITFTGGSLASSEEKAFTVLVQTGSSGAAAAAWTVAVSESDEGEAAACSGDTSVAISGDTTPPAISSVAVSDVTSDEATVTWNTDEAADSVVRYGTSTSYGSSASSGAQVTSHSVTLTGLSAGTTYHYQVQSTDASSNTAASSDATFTTDDPPPTLTISNVSAGSISSSQAKITWTTNVSASSRVDYGTTSSYGSSQHSGAQVTSHSVTLTGLSAGTTYHYRVQSTDSTSTTAQSSDNTLTTAAAAVTASPSPSPSPTSRPSTVVRRLSPVPTSSSERATEASPTPLPEAPAIAIDEEAPAVLLTTDFSQPYALPPQLEGEVRDNGAVARAEYSLDGGQNWLPALLVEGAGAPAARFAAVLEPLPDGNYPVQVRAYDTSGNEGRSPTTTLVIDQIPPRVGTSLYAVGGQPVTTQELTALVAGLDQQITLSAVGGATAIDLVARPLDGGGEQVFSLVQQPETGLWVGTLSFERAGTYELRARARDGAGNAAVRVLRTVTTVPGGRVAADDQGIAGATVTVWWFNPLTHLFEVWQGEPFLQENPQLTDPDGTFQFFLPPGRYYVAAQAAGWRPVQTEIFTLERSEVVRLTLPLAPRPTVRLGRMSLAVPGAWWPATVPAQSGGQAAPVLAAQPSAAGGQAPLGQGRVQTLNQEASLAEIVAGQPALIAFLAHWSPETPEQLAQLGDGLGLGRVVVPVLVQSTPAQAHLLGARGQYGRELWADLYGDVAAAFEIDATPTHVLIDAAGRIERVVRGLATASALDAQ